VNARRHRPKNDLQPGVKHPCGRAGLCGERPEASLRVEAGGLRGLERLRLRRRDGDADGSSLSGVRVARP
jgi:hypothetical protein